MYRILSGHPAAAIELAQRGPQVTWARRLNPRVTLWHWYSGATVYREQLVTAKGDSNKFHAV